LEAAGCGPPAEIITESEEGWRKKSAEKERPGGEKHGGADTESGRALPGKSKCFHGISTKTGWY